MNLFLKFRLILMYLFVSLLIFGGYYFYGSRPKELASPVITFSKINFSDNQWFPKILAETKEKDKNEPKISANAAFFVDTQSGQILYEKNSNQKLPIASLTKIMTVIVAMENTKLDSTFIISKRAADTEPDKMLLIAGEKLTTKELLDGIFLVSANDAAEVFAEGVTGRKEEFINLMNSKAKLLGMDNTLFINPTGLEEDNKSQYSTAFEVALMSRFAINKWPSLLEISSQPHIVIPRTKDHQDYDLYSGINLLTTYPGVVGLKTGYTPEAGLTLVTVARRGDKQVLGVLLGSTNRRDDARALLDYSFKKLAI